MLQWENDLTSYQEQSVTATFEALFAELDQDSSRLLKLLSFLDPERIPLNILIEGAKGLSQRDESPTTSSQPTHILLEGSSATTNDPATDTKTSDFISPNFRPLLTLIISPIKRKAAVQKLQRLSLVEQLFDRDQSCLRIHDLVQYIIGERAKNETTYREWLSSVVSLVCRAFGNVKDHHLPQSWPECESFLPHLHSLNERWSDVHGVNLALAKADIGIARYLISRGRYGEAEVVCERSVEGYEKECGTDHPDTLAAVDKLAYTYFMQGRYPDAQAAGERVLAERLKILGADHTDTLDSMNTLALVYSAQERFSKAEELSKGALAGFEKILGPDHRYTFTVMDNLAIAYMNQERFDDAEELLVRTLAGREKNFGRDDIQGLMTVHVLALVYQGQKRYADAEELYKRALFAKEQQLGSTHPETLATIFRLAHLYRSQARYSEAEEYFQRAFTGRMQELGASHPRTSQAAGDLAEFYRSQGRGSDADAVLNSLRDG
jgi:tetratricopeptide (TPR) repeat protein